MRVGVVGPLDDDSFARNIIECLPDVGATAVPLGPPRATLHGPRANRLNEIVSTSLVPWDLRQQQRLARSVHEQECDLVISISSGLLPQTVDSIRTQAPIVHWFPDHMANLGRQLMLAGAYTRVYFTDPELVRRVGTMTEVPVAYLPEACNPRRHRPIGEPQSRREITLAGNMYPSRVRVLDQLHRDGIPLALYGPGFPRWLPSRPVMSDHRRRSITLEEKAQVFRESAAVLNNLHPAEGAANCRLFEAAGSGAAVLCEYRPAIADLFELGTEIVTFSTYEELLSSAQRILGDPDSARALGDAAAARVLAEHTYEHRLRRIFEDTL